MNSCLQESDMDNEVYCSECECYISIYDLCCHYEILENREKNDEELETQESMEELHMQNRPALWDCSIPLGLRSRPIREKLWMEIHTLFKGKYNVDLLQKKWKNLRDQYVRMKTENESYTPSGSATSKKRKREWKYYDSLRFISDGYQRPSTSNLSESTPRKEKKKKVDPVGEAIVEAVRNLPPPPSVTSSSPVNPICVRLSESLARLPEE